MNYTYKTMLYILVLLVGDSCNNPDKKEFTNDAGKPEVWGAKIDLRSREKAFKKLVETYASKLTKQEKQKILKETWQGDFMMFQMNWNNFVDRAFPLPFDQRRVSQIYADLGIYGRDDRSDLIRESIYRYLKTGDVCVTELTSSSRNRFIKQTKVSPPELTRCPTCCEQMFTYFEGNGYPDVHPQVSVFSGECVNEHLYIYTQKNAWMRYKRTK